MKPTDIEIEKRRIKAKVVKKKKTVCVYRARAPEHISWTIEWVDYVTSTEVLPPKIKTPFFLSTLTEAISESNNSTTDIICQ